MLLVLRTCVLGEWRDTSRIVDSLADMIRAGFACWPGRASIGSANELGVGEPAE
jgi:hypothetical protein